MEQGLRWRTPEDTLTYHADDASKLMNLASVTLKVASLKSAITFYGHCGAAEASSEHNNGQNNKNDSFKQNNSAIRPSGVFSLPIHGVVDDLRSKH